MARILSKRIGLLMKHSLPGGGAACLYDSCDYREPFIRALLFDFVANNAERFIDTMYPSLRMEVFKA